MHFESTQCSKMRLWLGLCATPAGGDHSALSDSLSGFKETASWNGWDEKKERCTVEMGLPIGYCRL